MQLCQISDNALAALPCRLHSLHSWHLPSIWTRIVIQLACSHKETSTMRLVFCVLQVKLCADEWPREQNVTQYNVPTHPRYGPHDKLC